MSPIVHVPHHPCLPSRSIHYYGNAPITHVPITPVLITHVPYHLPPYTHVPHCPCPLLPMYPLPYPHVDLEGGHATLPIYPITPVPMSNGAHR